MSARVVVQPTTDVLVPTRPRLGHDIPTIGYGHWGVEVDDTATRPLYEARKRLADEQRWADIMAILEKPHQLEATITRR